MEGPSASVEMDKDSSKCKQPVRFSNVDWQEMEWKANEQQAGFMFYRKVKMTQNTALGAQMVKSKSRENHLQEEDWALVM